MEALGVPLTVGKRPNFVSYKYQGYYDKDEQSMIILEKKIKPYQAQGYYYKDEQSMIIWKIGFTLDFGIISLIPRLDVRWWKLNLLKY